jgi:hypothetical protein
MTVHWTDTPVSFINGSLPPLTYDQTRTYFINLHVGSGVTTGVFNFGASTSELYFQAGETSPEFPNRIDRVYTLSGATESIPDVTYGAPLGTACTLTFNVAPNGTTPADVHFGFNDADPSWNDAHPLGTPISFANCDFKTNPLYFKATDGHNNWETTGNRVLDDDILNKRTLSWTWNAATDF